MPLVDGIGTSVGTLTSVTTVLDIVMSVPSLVITLGTTVVTWMVVNVEENNAVLSSTAASLSQ
jgi:hypothetical protein